MIGRSSGHPLGTLASITSGSALIELSVGPYCDETGRIDLLVTGEGGGRVRIGMLGPVQVRGGAGWQPVAAEQQRLLLAVLLTHAGRTVSTEQLVDAVWPDRPPPGATNTVRAYVMRLRRLLGDGVLVTRSRGYELVVGPDDVDAMVFERTVAAGRRELDGGRLRTGVARLAKALALWRGPVFADVPANAALTARVAHLDQVRLAAEEDHLAALLDLDQHLHVVDELHRLVDEYPLRERRWVLLMRALDRCGRRAEALDAYQRARQVLRTELGIDPGPELRELQRAILTEDQPSGTGQQPPGTPAAAPDMPATPAATPAQLPADVAGFTGRADHLAGLDALLGAGPGEPATAVVISALEGSAGVGKTALAVHWTHLVRDRFGDGQLYVNLRGYADGPPVRPIEALARFLRALGVPNEQVPSDVDEASAAYRSLLAGRRVLVLLDNARDPEQVRPLLPGNPGCLALVTSRDRLSGLVARDGAVSMTLDVLTPDEAYALLARLLGTQRVQAEPQAAGEVAALCGHLPLALRIAAANLSRRRHTSIAEFATRLRQDRLDSLHVGGDGIRAAFALSYTALPAGARRLFRLLGQAPGADITVPAAAAIFGSEAVTTERLLDRLAAAHLVDEHVPGRYTLHDLLREYAAERAAGEDDAASRAAALDRLYEHYLRHVDAAATLVYPRVARLPTAPAADQRGMFAKPDDALSWLDSERATMVSAVCDGARHGLTARACHLADALRGYLHRGMYLTEWDMTARAGLAAAEADGGPYPLAAAWLSLTSLDVIRGRYPQALDGGGAALADARRAGWADGQSTALNLLGIAHAELGHLDQAADFFAEALAVARAANRTANQATWLGNLGNIELMRGRLDAAARHHTESLALHRDGDTPAGEALVLDQLGMAHHALGRLDTALVFLTDAQDRFAELGMRLYVPGNTRAIAAVHRDAGRHHDALRIAESALAAARDTGDRKAHADTLQTRASIRSALGHLQAAIDDYCDAAEIAREIGHHYIHTETLIGRATTHLRARQHPAAAEDAQAALAAAEQAGYRVLEGQALTALAAIRLADGDHDGALDTALRALSIHVETGHRQGQARTHLVVAEAYRRAGNAADADIHDKTAHALFTEIGGDAEPHTDLLRPP